ncbi:MAG: hypothetical protein IJ218_00120 [Alphaproteobacteria bacterium]|nr:hypothetical protein [Alphaproteobacteria bacterium]
MEKMSFNRCTLPVGKSCAIPSLREAVKAFTRVGKMGFVSLERVTLPSNKLQVVWTSRHNGRVIATLPVFVGETTASEMNCMPTHPVKAGELLRCGEYFYRICLNKAKEMEIRMLTILPDEDTVRNACELLGLNVVTVELIQMYSTTGKYLSGAWLIKTLGAEKPYTLMYVDFRDRLKLGEIDFDNVVYLGVTPKKRFSANGIWYELQKDEVDRLYLAMSPMQAWRQIRKQA